MNACRSTCADWVMFAVAERSDAGWAIQRCHVTLPPKTWFSIGILLLAPFRKLIDESAGPNANGGSDGHPDTHVIGCRPDRGPAA